MSFSITTTPGTSGYAKGTKFTFIASGVTITSQVGYKIRWDFGDGIIITENYNLDLNQHKITHTYEYAGTYIVKATVWQ